MRAGAYQHLSMTMCQVNKSNFYPIILKFMKNINLESQVFINLIVTPEFFNDSI
jgi:hypothetical protein